MSSDDLSSLFGPAATGPALPMSFRQGVLTAFNSDTGANTVTLGSSTLTNLPMLVTGAEIGLTAGDNVLLSQMGNTYLIIGKVASVGGSNYGGANLGRNANEVNDANFSVNPTGTVVGTLTFTVPGWAHSCQLWMMGQAAIHNNSGGLDNILGIVRASCPATTDGFTDGPITAVPSTFWGGASAMYVFTKAVVPGATLTCTFTLLTGVNTWPADALSYSSFFVLCDFYRET